MSSSSQAPGLAVRVPLAQTLRTYLIWLVGGWFGLHRFYLGHFYTGILYACTLGFVGIGWILDGFLLPRYLRKKAAREAEQEALLRELAQEQSPLTELTGEDGLPLAKEMQELLLAPWAEEKGKALLFRLQLFFGGLFLVLAPTILVVVAVLFQQMILIVLTAGILLFTSFLEQARSVIGQYEEQVKKLPFMKDIIKNFNGFYEYYIEHPPRGFFFYLFYFPVGLLSLIGSTQAREEFKLYLRIFGAIAAALIIATFTSQKQLYGGYVPISQIIILLLVNLLVLFIVILFYMMPTMTTAFAMSLTGRRKSLRLYTFVGLSLAVLVGIIGSTQERDAVSIMGQSILQSKFKNKTFVKDLHRLSVMFLEYQHRHAKKQKQGGVWKYQAALTKELAGYITPLAAKDQKRAFRVLTLAPDFQDRPLAVWHAILYRTHRDNMLLYLLSPRGQIYTSWKQLPVRLQRNLPQTKLPLLSKAKGGMAMPKEKRQIKALEPGLLQEALQSVTRQK